MDKKIFYIDINEDDNTGLDAISLVSTPAVEIDFLCFEKDGSKEISFSANEDKHIISGIALRADFPIYRRNGDYEYYVVFTKEIIRKIVNKYAKNGLFNSVNLQHNDHNFTNKAIMIESYIIDKERGICPIEFSDIEDGSWYVSFHIEDEMLWNEVKDGKILNGFSVQGLFNLIEDSVTNNEEKLSQQKEQTFDEWLEELINIAEMK